jgi:RNA polymerase sigma-70 factor (ECF subfamily)
MLSPSMRSDTGPDPDAGSHGRRQARPGPAQPGRTRGRRGGSGQVQPSAELVRVVAGQQEPLQWYLRYLGCPVDEVADLVQETFLRLFRRADFEHRADEATAAWLRKTARHLWLRSLGRRARERRLQDPQPHGHAHPGLPDAAIDEAWDRFRGDDEGETYLAALRHCLGRLKDRARRALELQFQDGLPRREIAARMGLSDGGTKTLLARTRQALRECIERRARA